MAMTDFLDRYGEQLRWARKRRRRRLTGVSVAAVVVPVAVVGILLAVASAPPDVERPAQPPTATPPPTSGTWTPKVGRPKQGLPASIDHTPVSPAAVGAFAVLRRPQTERDRRLAKPHMRSAGGMIIGIQVDGV